jgi:hypothetical protein
MPTNNEPSDLEVLQEVEAIRKNATAAAIRNIEKELAREYSELASGTFEFVPRLIALRRETLRSAVHNAGTGDWISTLSNLLQLMNTGNNLAQMYGWSRFCWTFGGLDTANAHAQLDRLLRAVQLAFSGTQPGPFGSTHKRHGLRGLLSRTRLRGKALRELVLICAALVKADAQWPDRQNWKESSNETH